MEKRDENQFKLRKFLITGPESTGKSEITAYLAEYFAGIAVPEYARDYLMKLNRKYGYEDVVEIARQQVKEYRDCVGSTGIYFFDTWLVITKVWFELVFGMVPDWIESELRNASFDLVLVCAPDIPWIPDPFRENGGRERVKLYHRYIYEIRQLDWPFHIVKGSDANRYRNAVNGIQKILTDNGSC